MKFILAIAVVLSIPLPFQNGDMNRDGLLSTTDLVLIRREIGGHDLMADLNFDGAIDEKDLHIMRVKLSEGKIK